MKSNIRILKLAEIDNYTHSGKVMYVDKDNIEKQYYVNILEDFYKNSDIKILDTSNKFWTNNDLRVFNHSEIEVGKPFSINGGSWQTSIVEEVIDNVILVTKNSVYVLYNLEELRERKLKDLGI